MIPDGIIHLVNQELLCDKQYNDYLRSSGFRDGLVEGRKEVVEYIRLHGFYSPHNFAEWQKQLRKWGIE